MCPSSSSRNGHDLKTLNASTAPSPTSAMRRYRPTWVNISTEAFAANVRAMKAWVGPRVSFLAVLKADAYGHGAAALAGTALESGASAIGVSSIEEGLALREAGVTGPILIL